MSKEVSIHDIARELGVSAATVSYVLNGKAREKRISVIRERQILKYAKKVNYRPNLVAKSLRTGKSKVIAMLVEGIDDPFFSSIARIVESEMNRRGYRIFFASTQNNPDTTIELINNFREIQVEGFIIAPPPGIEKTISTLIEEDFPTVLFDRYYPDLNSDNIVIDNYEGVYNAMQHFFKGGFQQIGFVTLDSNQIQMKERLRGYESALKERSLASYVLKIPYELRENQAQMTIVIRDFLKKKQQVTAVLFATNYLAISGLEAMDSLGLKIPEDMAIIGFDDNALFALFTPSVTAIAQPIRELSERVVEQLMTNLNTKNKNSRKSTIKLQTKLIVRGSTINRKRELET